MDTRWRPWSSHYKYLADLDGATPRYMESTRTSSIPTQMGMAATRDLKHMPLSALYLRRTLPYNCRLRPYLDGSLCTLQNGISSRHNLPAAWIRSPARTWIQPSALSRSLAASLEEI